MLGHYQRAHIVPLFAFENAPQKATDDRQPGSLPYCDAGCCVPKVVNPNTLEFGKFTNCYPGFGDVDEWLVAIAAWKHILDFV
jgi:hypothetical protein